MKSYKETKAAFKALVERVGLDNILNLHLTELYNDGHSVANVQNAFSYFQFSPKAAKYRTGA